MLTFVEASWGYAVFVIPFLVAAVGMSMTNGPCSSVSTSAVPEEQVGAASGISNMARYVGAAVFTASPLPCTASDTTDSSRPARHQAEALAAGVRRVAIVMAVALGARHPAGDGRQAGCAAGSPTMIDYAPAAAAHTHTLPRPDPIPFVRNEQAASDQPTSVGSLAVSRGRGAAARARR